jgi:hypothetical protein
VENRPWSSFGQVATAAMGFIAPRRSPARVRLAPLRKGPAFVHCVAAGAENTRCRNAEQPLRTSRPHPGDIDLEKGPDYIRHQVVARAPIGPPGSKRRRRRGTSRSSPSSARCSNGTSSPRAIHERTITSSPALGALHSTRAGRTPRTRPRRRPRQPQTRPTNRVFVFTTSAQLRQPPRHRVQTRCSPGQPHPGQARPSITLDTYTHLFNQGAHTSDIRDRMAAGEFARALKTMGKQRGDLLASQLQREAQPAGASWPSSGALLGSSHPPTDPRGQRPISLIAAHRVGDVLGSP